MHIPFERVPWKWQNIKAYKALSKLMQRERFDIVHCNTPIGGVLGRLAAKRNGIPFVIYQAHGFHFWKGAPLKNWLIYYPVERTLARLTDILITINREDFERAKCFTLRKNGKLLFVHGVGVDTSRFIVPIGTPKMVCQELGISNTDIVCICVAELIPRKNYHVLLEAFVKAALPNAHLLICGDGVLRTDLETWISSHAQKNIHLLGFRRDVVQLLYESDIFVFPSFQEGLPGALMEAMAAGKCCIVSRIRGNVDLLGEDYTYLFEPRDTKTLVGMIIKAGKEIQETNKYTLLSQERIKKYDFEKVVMELADIYRCGRETVRSYSFKE